VNLGIIKIWVDRLSWHVSKAQLFMIAYLFFQTASLTWWYLLIVPYFIIAVYIERKYVMPQEWSYGVRKNPEMVRLIEMVEVLYKERTNDKRT